MIINGWSGTLPLLPARPVVVVGSGAAGIALTLALADAGVQVVLVEAGGDVGQFPASSQEPGRDASTPVGSFDLWGSRASGLGGTTALWHGQCMRLHEEDLAERTWVPGSGWPFDLTELATPYAAAEAWLDVSGRGYGAERWAGQHRRSPPAWDGELLRHDFTEYVPHRHLGRRHRRNIDAHPRVWALLRTTVTRVLTEHGRLIGVELADAAGARAALPSARVVLACGAVENARVLQLSDEAGVGLGTGRELTGRYLQTHPVIQTARVEPTEPKRLQDTYGAMYSGGRRLFPKVRLAAAVQEQERLVDACAIFLHTFDDAQRGAARRLVAAARARRRPENVGADLRLAARAAPAAFRDALRQGVHGLGTALPPAAVHLEIWLEQVPDRGSRLLLSPQTDALGLRETRIEWQPAEVEMRTSRVFTTILARELTRLGIAVLHELPPMNDDRAWLAAVRDAAHPAGTTRMSRSPQHGVVDADLEVHGVPGLYVVGSSAFPVAGYANPTLTIVALALRLAGHLQRQALPAVERTALGATAERGH